MCTWQGPASAPHPLRVRGRIFAYNREGLQESGQDCVLAVYRLPYGSDLAKRMLLRVCVCLSLTPLRTVLLLSAVWHGQDERGVQEGGQGDLPVISLLSRASAHRQANSRRSV